jgi:hypothetical protein
MSFDLIEVILAAMVVALLFVVLIVSVVSKGKTTKLYAAIAQLVVDKQILSDEVKRLSFMANNSPAIENDFIKFLSDSRDSAYDYIEDVQATLLELKDLVDSDGSELEVDMCYQKLINLLPSEDSDKAK